MIPEIVSAAAELAVAVENGVGMRRNRPRNNPPPALAAATASGISGTEFMVGMTILALALVGAALLRRTPGAACLGTVVLADTDDILVVTHAAGRGSG
jgi:hypothetical protein